MKSKTEKSNKRNQIRKFRTGATRDTDTEKLNYVKALSPLVLQKYVEYIGKHRKQSNGQIRDWDNWKRGIPRQTYLESMQRHLIAVWLLHDGYSASDNYGDVLLEDSLCGLIFNAMGYLYEVVNQENTKSNEK